MSRIDISQQFDSFFRYLVRGQNITQMQMARKMFFISVASTTVIIQNECHIEF